MRNAPVELQEIQYPFLIERFALRRDSGGAGRHRGGLGVELTYRALGKTLTNVNCERTKDPPWELNGGGSGTWHAVWSRWRSSLVPDTPCASGVSWRRALSRSSSTRHLAL